MRDQRRENESVVGPVGVRADGCEVVCTLPETSLGERVAWLEREVLPHVRLLQTVSKLKRPVLCG